MGHVLLVRSHLPSLRIDWAVQCSGSISFIMPGISSLFIPFSTVTLPASRVVLAMLWSGKPQVKLLSRWSELIQFKLSPSQRTAFNPTLGHKLHHSHFSTVFNFSHITSSWSSWDNNRTWFFIPNISEYG